MGKSEIEIEVKEALDKAIEIVKKNPLTVGDSMKLIDECARTLQKCEILRKKRDRWMEKFDELKERNKPFENLCPYCKGDKRIRNPTGDCEHLHYPENVNKNYPMKQSQNTTKMSEVKNGNSN